VPSRRQPRGPRERPRRARGSRDPGRRDSRALRLSPGVLAPRFLPAGECAAVIELGNAIAPELSARVLALDRALLSNPFPGYLEAIPTYRSLLVFFDPLRASLDSIREHVSALPGSKKTEASSSSSIKEVPAVYDGEDLEDVARRIGASVEDVVRLHAEREYLVYMVGFTPGFAYMGSTDDRLRLSRRASPRTRVPAGSVAIAMGQTGIYPSSTPGGWHILARADHRILFDFDRDPPSFFVPGDRVRFVPVEALPPFTPRAPATPPKGAPALEVVSGGLLTTVQDLGRVGYQRYGVPVAGAVDAPAHRAANRLAGNAPEAATLECTVEGPTLRALRPIVVAVTGADLGAVVERSDVGRFAPPPWSSFFLRPGNVLRFEGRRSGARAYVAVSGGFDVPEVLGSRSTYLIAGFGGLEGRPLRAGDRLSAGATEKPPSPGERMPPPPPAEDLPIRVVLGPQDDYFTEAALETLESATYAVQSSSDRMGYRLDGPPLEHKEEKEIVSDGMMLGGIQVPPNGLPIVMLADRATTGGYPKIATVVHADLPRLAQKIPGERVRFGIVGLEEAREAFRNPARRNHET
jgi:KipI family sensor histidine kinase inhibitor